MITLVRAVQTCFACPSQWDAWDVEGRYVYLRYRYGHGTVQLAPDVRSSMNGMKLVASWQDADHMAGVISLRQFCDKAGIQLAKNIEVR